MGVARASIAVLGASIALASTASADVDWQKGLVAGRGVGIADRHAPSPAAAREPARRAAEDAARKAIAAQLGALPLAAGGTLQTKLADKAIAARVDRAVAAAITLDAAPQTDGSWTITMAVPIEALRQAIDGERAQTAADADPPVVIVLGVSPKPAIGYTVGGIAGATVWLRSLPDWVDKDAPRVKATGMKQGAIDVATPTGGPSTLFVLVVKS